MSIFRKIKARTEETLKAEMPTREIYPHFGIDLKHLPEAKKWKVGGKYQIALQLQMTGLTIEEGVGKEYSNASFDIKGIKVESSIKDMSKEEFENYQAKVRSGQA